MAFKSSFLLLLCSAAVCRAGLAKPRDTLVAAYESLPKSEKNAFLAYSLGQSLMDEEKKPGELAPIISIGQSDDSLKFQFPAALNLTEDLTKKFEAIKVPTESLSALLSWTKDEFQLDEDQIKMLLVRSIVCLPPGCVDWGDVGDRCCPW